LAGESMSEGGFEAAGSGLSLGDSSAMVLRVVVGGANGCGGGCRWSSV
jgi:hypothetical protein